MLVLLFDLSMQDKNRLNHEIGGGVSKRNRVSTYLLSLVFQMENSSPLWMVKRGRSVAGTQNKSQQNEDRNSLKTQAPADGTIQMEMVFGIITRAGVEMSRLK